MPYQMVNAAFEFNGGTAIKKRCMMPRQRSEIFDIVPGRNAIGKLDPEGPRAASRWFELSGLQFEETGQESASVPCQNEQLYKAGGMLRSGTIGTGLTYTVGDFHASTDTPAGDLVRLTSCDAYFDGQNHPGGSLVADLSWHFVTGQIPFLNVDLLGIIADGDAVGSGDLSARTTSESAVAVPALTAALAVGLPWTGAVFVSSTFSLGIVKEIVVSLNNRLTKRPSAAAEMGYAAPCVTGRDVRCRILTEKQANQTNENAWIRGTNALISWTYISAVAAGGIVLNTNTHSFTGALTQLPDVQDVEGNWCTALELQMDPATPYSIVHS